MTKCIIFQEIFPYHFNRESHVIMHIFWYWHQRYNIIYYSIFVSGMIYLLLLESLYLLVRVVWRLRDDTLSFSISSPLLALLLWINTALSSLLILTH